MAAIHDWFDAVKVLVEAGADIHLRDLAGFTALDYARRNLRSAAESYLQDKWLDDLGNQDSGLFVLAFQNPSHNQSSSSMEVIDDEMEDIPLLSPSF
jgi:ankyrin repeat protein